jgi:ribosomal protein S18 acetylase RimI-like enzyme
MLKPYKELWRIYKVIKNRTLFEYGKNIAIAALARIYYQTEVNIYEKLLQNAEGIIENEYAGYRIKMLNLNDLNIMQHIAGPILMRRFENNLHRGNACLLAYCKDNIMGYSWIDFHCGEKISGGRHKLEDKEAYFFGSYVLPKFRNRGVYFFMCQKRVSFLKQLGYCKARVLAVNHFAQKALLKLEFTKVGSIVYKNTFSRMNTSYK